MSDDDAFGMITVVFYLVAVPIGIGAFTRGAVWLAVFSLIAIPLLAVVLTVVAVIASLIASARPIRLP